MRRPDSAGIELHEVWIRRKRALTLVGSAASTEIGVWIGGTPASCRINDWCQPYSRKKLARSGDKSPSASILRKKAGSLRVSPL